MPPPQAFTLAEVLITLGIIGVVAALTIPTLISNHKKHEVEVRLQRAYSTINQAVKLAVAEQGDTAEWDYSSTEIVAKKYIIPYLQGAEFIPNKNLQNYFVKFPDKNPVPLSGGTSSGIKLKTGEIIRIYDSKHSSDIAFLTSEPLYVILKQNKNNTYIPGKDYFPMYISKLNNMVYIYPPYNATYHILTEAEYISGCQQSGWEWGCAMLIVKNGWKIPDNYPIKF